MAKTNKYALVTGGSRGIGREICLKLGGCGYHVLVNYKSNAAEAEKTLSGIRAAGGDGEALQFDVASGEESTAAIEAWQKAHEGACIEVVVNNAGIRDDVLMMWMEPQQWHSVIGTSLDGFYNVTRPLLKGMLVNRFGRIVNIVSLSGIKGLPGQANYAAAKGGVIAATKALAQEVAKKGVTVNAIAPGFFLTEQNRALLTNPDGTYTQRGQDVIRQTPFGRMGRAEELCGTIQYLISDAASFVTGTVAVVDGGFNAFAM